MPCAPKNPKLVLSAGELRDRIVIEQRDDVRDEIGGAATTWSTFAKVWAGIKPVGGQWQFQDGKPTTPVLHKVRMRYLPGLLGGGAHRIRFGDRLFQILAILNIDERRIVHELTCQELDSDG